MPNQFGGGNLAVGNLAVGNLAEARDEESDMGMQSTGQRRKALDLAWEIWRPN